VTLTSHSFTSSALEATSFLPSIAATRAFWSAKDELLLFKLRKSKMTYTKIVSQFQTPPRTVTALKSHFHKIKGRLKDDGELTAEWAKKYEIASKWELREGCRFELRSPVRACAFLTCLPIEDEQIVFKNKLRTNIFIDKRYSSFIRSSRARATCQSPQPWRVAHAVARRWADCDLSRITDGINNRNTTDKYQ
jgi:hypothetical protein